MRLTQYCSKFLPAAVLIVSGTFFTPAQAVTLNFTAVLTNGTCTLSLDKSNLPLGNITKSLLRAGQLVAPQPFILSVRDCTGDPGTSLKPTVTITGNGVTQDNKWLFRNAGSATGAGILVFQSDSVPAYSSSEVKNNTVIQLANAGQIPANRNITFYAGASCGGTTGCATTGTGNVTASLMFTFGYQ